MIPGRALEIRYARAGGDRGRYRHVFGRGVRMLTRRDGAVLLKGRRRIWADDREPGFRYTERSNPMKRRRSSDSSLLWLALGGLTLYFLLQPRAGQMYAAPIGPQRPVVPVYPTEESGAWGVGT
jgi:hypothetical protein